MNGISRFPLHHAIGLCVSALVLFGLIMVYSASAVHHGIATGATSNWMSTFHTFQKQFLFMGLGLVIMMIVSKVPVIFWTRFSKGWLVLALVLLGLCYLPGIASPQVTERMTVVRRWIEIGGLRFQPSEAVKLLLVIYLACTWGRKLELNSGRLRGSLLQLALMLVPIAMIAAEPDKKGAIFCSVMVLALWFMANGSLVLLGFAGMVAGTVCTLFIINTDYARQRFMMWWAEDPTKNWQTCQALVAYYQGGLFGAGPGGGQQKLGYLPARANDMIFAVVGEETGIFGAAGVILAYAALTWMGFLVASRCEKAVPRLLAAGVTVMLVSQAMLNIAVATVLAPTTGLCLPFVSYGGSSLVVSMAAVGILLHVAKNVHQAEEAVWRGTP